MPIRELANGIPLLEGVTSSDILEAISHQLGELYPWLLENAVDPDKVRLEIMPSFKTILRPDFTTRSGVIAASLFVPLRVRLRSFYVEISFVNLIDRGDYHLFFKFWSSDRKFRLNPIDYDFENSLIAYHPLVKILSLVPGEAFIQLVLGDKAIWKRVAKYLWYAEIIAKEADKVREDKVRVAINTEEGKTFNENWEHVYFQPIHVILAEFES